MACVGKRMNYARFPAVLGVRVVMLQPSVPWGKEHGPHTRLEIESLNESSYFVRENDFVNCQFITVFEINIKRNRKNSLYNFIKNDGGYPPSETLRYGREKLNIILFFAKTVAALKAYNT